MSGGPELLLALSFQAELLGTAPVHVALLGLEPGVDALVAQRQGDRVTCLARTQHAVDVDDDAVLHEEHDRLLGLVDAHRVRAQLGDDLDGQLSQVVAHQGVALCGTALDDPSDALLVDGVVVSHGQNLLPELCGTHLMTSLACDIR